MQISDLEQWEEKEEKVFFGSALLIDEKIGTW